MRLLVQRTRGVEVWIDHKLHSSTGPGLLALFGARTGDREASCAWLADKTANLRIFEDDRGKMNLSALDTNGEIMVVSQFTLYADTRKGRRPSYNDAMEPLEAERLCDMFISELKATSLTVASGVFGAMMDVKFTNCGPVTIMVEHEL